MTTTTYVLGVAAAALTLIIAVELLRRRHLRERHAIWWIVAGSLALLVSLFPVTLEWAAGVIGIALPTNLIFFVSSAILFLICLQHSAELTRVEGSARDLAESIALLELRVREVEAQQENAYATRSPRDASK